MRQKNIRCFFAMLPDIQNCPVELAPGILRVTPGLTLRSNSHEFNQFFANAAFGDLKKYATFEVCPARGHYEKWLLQDIDLLARKWDGFLPNQSIEAVQITCANRRNINSKYFSI